MQCIRTVLRLLILLCLLRAGYVATSEASSTSEPVSSSSHGSTKEGGTNTTHPPAFLNSTTNSTGSRDNYTLGSSANISHSNAIKNLSELQGLLNNTRFGNETEPFLKPMLPPGNYTITPMPPIGNHTSETMPSPTASPSTSHGEVHLNKTAHKEEPPGNDTMILIHNHNSTNVSSPAPNSECHFCWIDFALFFGSNNLFITYINKSCTATLYLKFASFQITHKDQILPESIDTKTWTNWTDSIPILIVPHIVIPADKSPNSSFFMEYTFNCSQKTHIFEQPFSGPITELGITVSSQKSEVAFGDSLYISYDVRGTPKPKTTVVSTVWDENKFISSVPDNFTHNEEQMYLHVNPVTVNQTFTLTAVNYYLESRAIKSSKATALWTVTVTFEPPSPSYSIAVSSCNQLESSLCHVEESSANASHPSTTVALPAPPDPVYIIILVIFCFFVFAIIALIVSTVVAVRCCHFFRSGQTKVVVRPWARDVRDVNLPYFNDNYYKTKYGVIGDYRLPSIARKDFVVGDLIGEGHFGSVYKATFGLDGSGEPILVAAKCVNLYGSADKMKEFFHEARFMGHLNHPNIVRLHGISVSQEPFYLISEYMCEGDLRQFLHRAAGSLERHVFDPEKYESARVSSSSCDPPQLGEQQLICICFQIAQAMEYMARHAQIHRDLAARNCLVGSNLVVKITDFGLSRSLYQKNYYRVRSGAEVPVRWLAPEALIRGEFSVDSDVWAFGVVIWEVFSFGHHPYYSLSNEEILKWLSDSNILEQPINCPDSIYTIVKDCWQWDRSHRPTFSRLVCMLEEHLSKLGHPSLPAYTPSLSHLSEQDDADKCYPPVFGQDTVFQIDRLSDNFVALGQSTEV